MFVFAQFDQVCNNAPVSKLTPCLIAREQSALNLYLVWLLTHLVFVQNSSTGIRVGWFIGRGQDTHISLALPTRRRTTNHRCNSAWVLLSKGSTGTHPVPRRQEHTPMHSLRSGSYWNPSMQSPHSLLPESGSQGICDTTAKLALQIGVTPMQVGASIFAMVTLLSVSHPSWTITVHSPVGKGAVAFARLRVRLHWKICQISVRRCIPPILYSLAVNVVGKRKYLLVQQRTHAMQTNWERETKACMLWAGSLTIWSACGHI